MQYGWLELLIGIIFAVISLEDFRKRKISKNHLLMLFLFVILETGIKYWYRSGSVYLHWNEKAFIDNMKSMALQIIPGMLPGIFLLLIGKITGEKIGYGDGWLLMILGIYMGFAKVFLIFCIALFISMFVSGIFLIFQRLQWNSKIPFAPFLFGGYVLAILPWK